MPENILIVDDEPNYRFIIGEMLSAQGYGIVAAASGREAFEIFKEHLELDLVLTDMTMPDGNGIELLEQVRSLRPEVPVIMLTAHGTVELAVEAMKKGAFDYLTKPYQNEELVRTVAKALELSRVARQNKELRAELTKRHSFGNLIGKSKPMLELYQLLEKVSPTKATVLITGESGTGKELVARAIHYNSLRSAASFVAVNCSALSSSLLESELFGYEKGSFTGAMATRAGRFELAHGGTLFLDEIGEIGQTVQVKLLRVLQERSLERVGGGVPINVDVRLVAATNRDLKSEVEAGNFREDLYYRLNVVHLRLPSLRERLDDLPLLIKHFLTKHGQDRADHITFNPETKRMLFDHLWPGNVRELENVVERCLVLASGDEIMPADLPEDLRHQARVATKTELRGEVATESPESGWIEQVLSLLPQDLGLNETLALVEEGLLRRAMDLGDGVQSHAADILGLKRNVFKYKWDKYSEIAASPQIEAMERILPGDLRIVEAMELVEKEMLKRALTQSGGVHSRTSEILGLKKNLLQYKLKKYPDLVN